jgi:hypothetical protein
MPSPTATSERPGNLDECLRRIERMVAMRSALKMLPDEQVPYVQPLLDTIDLFERLQIPYALIGGVAAMYYGRARFTDDLDFVAVTGHMDVLARNSRAMQDCHFDPACTFKLSHDSGVEIDLRKDEHADEIIARAVEANLAGRKIRIADPHDLIAMKLRAGRIQDDYDISEIVLATPIDEPRVAQVVTPPQFQHLEAIKRRMNGT